MAERALSDTDTANLAYDIIVRLGTEWCAHLCIERKWSHTGKFWDCPTERCREVREQAAMFCVWESCPGEHRPHGGGWQRKIPPKGQEAAQEEAAP